MIKMEYQSFLSFPFLSAFILFAISAIIWRKTKNAFSCNLPPGPRNLPIIGSMHHLFRCAPHLRLSDLAKQYGPIMRLRLGEVTTIVISSPETAKQVMKTHDINFAQRPFMLAANIIFYNHSDVAFAPYGDYWRQLKKICMLELLSARRVGSYRSIRAEELSKFIASIHSSSGSPINLSSIFKSINYSIISRVAFGKVWNGQDIFFSLTSEVGAVLAGFSLPDFYPSNKWLPRISGMKRRAEKIHRQLDKLLEDIIDQHMGKNSVMETELMDGDKDFVDVLLDLQKHGDFEFPLSRNNIKAVILEMFLAGSDTSRTASEWTMSELMRNPKSMEKAQAEIRRVFSGSGEIDEAKLEELNYLRSVVKEALRLHPPLPLVMPRECREKCEINGYEIPTKSKVLVNAWAIGRDPNYWVDAEKFIPERFLETSIDYKGSNLEFIPFGAGRRLCPGISFAMVSVLYTLSQLLYHFDWKLPNEMTPENLDMTESFNLGLQRQNDLVLVPVPYFPLHTK